MAQQRSASRLQRQQRQYPFADSGLVDLPQLFKDYGDLNYAHVDDDGCGWLINSHSDLLESIQKQLGVINKLVRPVSSAQQSSVSTASQQQSAGGNGDVKVSEAPKNTSFARAKASEVASTEKPTIAAMVPSAQQSSVGTAQSVPRVV